MSEENQYTDGRRALANEILRSMIGELQPDVTQQARAIQQLERARDAIRFCCRFYGDNDWKDTLDLGDVVEKHLMTPKKN